MSGPDEWREETFDDGTVRGQPPRVILVAIDFSPPSRHALAWALDYAQLTPCEIHTLHVVDRRWHRADLETDAAALKAELAQVHAGAAAELARFFDDDSRRKAGVLHEHVAVGAPADEILALAGALDVAIVVVGGHGHGALERWLVGSVAEKVVRAATCPVVVVKPPAAHGRP